MATGWIVTVREDSETTPETLAAASQSEFQFVYVPFNAQPRRRPYRRRDRFQTQGRRHFTVARTGTGTYEITIPGKTGADGTLLLQVADIETGTAVPLASRAFLSYEFSNGKFIVQSRKTTTDSTADLADASFYVAWVDFQNPSLPARRPPLAQSAPVVVSAEGVTAKETGLAANTDAPEVLVTSIDSTNASGGYTDPITQQTANMAMVGRFYDPRPSPPPAIRSSSSASPSGTSTART
jgi:hypothetical protein